MRDNNTTSRLPGFSRAGLIEHGVFQLYLAVMLYVYSKYVTELFSYQGLVDKFEVARLSAASFALFLSIAILGSTTTVVGFFLLVIVTMILVPSLTLFVAAGFSWSFIWVTIGAYFVLVITARWSRVKIITVKLPGLTFRAFEMALLGITIVVIFWAISLGGLGNFNIDFTRVYEFRSDAAEGLPYYFSYLFPWMAKVLIPAGLVISIHLGNRWRVLVWLSLAFILFGLSSHKAIIFYPVLAVFAYHIAGRYGGARLVVLCVITVIAAATSIMSLTGEVFYFSMFVRRALLVPVYLNGVYIDFFSSNDFAYWSESRISFGLIPSSYNLDIVNLIGYEYFGSSSMGANTGWVGSGYANAGLFGVLVYSVALGLMLNLLGSYGRRLDMRVVSGVGISPLLTAFMSSDLITSILTHGIAMAVLVLALLASSASGRRLVKL